MVKGINAERLVVFRGKIAVWCACLAVFVACQSENLTRPAPEPLPKIDPVLAALLKAERFTGTVISLVDPRTGRVNSVRSTSAKSQPKPGAATSHLAVAPATSMANDLCGDLMFVVQPAGGKGVPHSNPQFSFKLFWNCYANGIDYGRIKFVTVGNIGHMAYEGTGGHTGTHTGPKPFGRNDPFNGVTDGDGFFPTTYFATQVSGDEIGRGLVGK